MSRQTIDFETGLSIDFELNPQLSNLHAMNYLPSGLLSLAVAMREQEQRAFDFWKGGIGMMPDQIRSIIEPMGISGADNNLCICFFHWFSVSLVNYLKLIGYIDFLEKEKLDHKDATNGQFNGQIKKHCDAYSKAACPEIIIWRNKVGAHIALTSPYLKDNQGTLEMSAMNSISYQNLKIYTGKGIWSAGGQNSEIPSWSLCEIFESLASRYWPHLVLTELRH